VKKWKEVEEGATTELQGKCMTQSVQSAERKLRFHSNLMGQDLYTVGNVTKSAGKDFDP